MSANKEQIIEQYKLGDEENRFSLSRSSNLEFYYTKKHLDGLIKETDRVLEIGCATGHYGFYYADKCLEYFGVDIVPEHIRLFEQKISKNRIKNISCQVGDATNLSDIKDNSFDVILCLGPMYHLTADERDRVFSECARICKAGGVAAFAYINKIGVYAGACITNNGYPNKQANQCVIENGTDDLRPDLFFFTTPEKMNISAEKYGFRKIKNLGTDFLITAGIVDPMSEEQFEAMRPLYDQMTSHESCTGMSNHALLICTKHPVSSN